MKLCNAVAACMAMLPLIVVAQDVETPAAEATAGRAPAHQHMQGMQQHMQRMGAMHAAEDGAASSSRCAEDDTPCSMNELRSQNGMMQQRVRLLEERLDAMQEQLRQLLERLDAVPGAAARP